jgi:hypothetical protein
VTDAGLRALAASDTLAGLARLGISGNRFSASPAKLLASRLRRLREVRDRFPFWINGFLNEESQALFAPLEGARRP